MSVRRTRRSRERRGNEPAITARDVAVFLLLSRYKFLDSRALWQLLSSDVRGSDRTYFIKRLRQLTDWGYLYRPLDTLLRGKNVVFFGYEVYQIRERGEEHLQLLGLIEEDITGIVAGAGLQFPHALMICSTLASLELGARQAGLRFITWQEILAKAPRETLQGDDPFLLQANISYPPLTGNKSVTVKLRPDSPPFGFAYPAADGERYIFGVLEAERTSKGRRNNLKLTSFLKKALVYREVRKHKLYKTRFGLPNLLVFTATPSNARIDTLASIVMDLTENEGSEMFCFRHILGAGSSYEMPPLDPTLFFAPWKRAGKEDFAIGHPSLS